jgi:REP element-mobilizing transposase RayT
MRLYKYEIKMPDDKFEDKYRIPSVRLEDYDYSQPGDYFVTICVKDRKCCLGEVKNGKVVLSDTGKIVRDELLKTPKIRPNVLLNEWVIMPNHVHVIFEIMDIVETHCNASLQWQSNKFGPQRNNLASIIRGFKGAVIRRIKGKCKNSNFAWQARYYDNVITDERAYNEIVQYIKDNPARWAEDEENPQNFKK